MPRKPVQPRSTAASWKTLERELGRALALMGDGEWQYLVLTDLRTQRYVQFAVHAESPLRAEAVSNDYLAPAHALGKAQERALVGLGWHAPRPRGRSRTKTPMNFFREFGRPVDHRQVAAMAVATLRDVFQTPFPARLEYDAFERGDKAILFPTLELVRRRPGSPGDSPATKPSSGEIRKQVRTALRKSSGIARLDFDADGDLTFRYESALVVVRFHDDPAHLVVYSPVLTNVEPTPALAERLAGLNRKVKFARLFEDGGSVFAAVEVFTDPLVTAHVVSACESLGDLAAGLDGDLAVEFGGKVAFAAKEERAAPQMLGESAARADQVPRPLGFRVR